MGSEEFAQPRTVAEAARLASEPGALVVAGGTAVGVLLRQGFVEPDRLVWIGRIPELRGVEVTPGGDLRVGAAVTLDELALSPVVLERCPMLVQAARAVGNARVRAVATVGGAVAHADPRQDLLPPLLAADASVRVAGDQGVRAVRLRDGFFRGLLETGLAPGELVTAVCLPSPGERVEGYERFTPASMDDYPTVSVAARVRLEPTGEVASSAVAVGGAGSTPVVAAEAVGVLAGRRPTSDVVAEAARAVGAAVDPTDDERGSARYKAAMAQAVTRRLLARILAAAAGPGQARER